jgi:NAD(P)H dehydrogenase (quinone)
VNIFIVYAHPEPQSFIAVLKNRAIEVLTQQGHSLQFSDLYAMRFKATADADDFTERYDPAHFDLIAEQTYAVRRGTFTPDIAQEQRKLQWADAVLFYCPLWWYSIPGILKGWFDRVLAAGFAYGPESMLAGKKAMFTVTTGGKPRPFTPEKRAVISDILDHVQRGTLHICGMSILPPFAAYGGDYTTRDQGQQYLLQYTQVLLSLPELTPMNYSQPGSYMF